MVWRELLAGAGLIALLAALITYVLRLLYAATITVPAKLSDELQRLEDQRPRLDDVTLYGTEGSLWSAEIHNQGAAAVFRAYLRVMRADGRAPPETFRLCFNKGAVSEKRLLSGERAELILGELCPDRFEVSFSAGEGQFRTRGVHFNDSDDGKSIDVEVVVTAEPRMVNPVRLHLRISPSGIEVMEAR